MTDYARIAEAVSRSFADDGWDQPPRLGVIVEELPHGDEEIFAVIGLPLPDDAWDGIHPAAVITFAAQVVSQATDAPPLNPGQKVVGVLAAIESYQGIVPERATKEERQEFVTWCETHSIADHPWGHEARNTWVVGFDGSFVHTDHVRDYGTHRTWTGDKPGTVATGRLVDALTEFADAMKKVTR